MRQYDFSLFPVDSSEQGNLFCLKRGNVIQANSEEYIRQSVLKYLIEEVGVNIDDIEVEYYLGKIDGLSNRRADILVYHKSIVLLVIEVKAPGIELTEDIFEEQALDYAKSAAHPELIWITNGYHNQFFVFREDQKKYLRLEVLPDIKSPEQMKLAYYKKNNVPWISPTYSQLWNKEFTDQLVRSDKFEYLPYWFHSTHIKQETKAANIRIGEWLLFSKEIPKGTTLGPFTVIEDKGVIYKTIPVPGHRYHIDTRTLLVKSRYDETLVWDTGIIFLNQEKEAHLASRISKNGSGSFNIQAALDTNYSWDWKMEKFQFSHNPNRLTMGKNNLGLKQSEYISQKFPNILDASGKFTSLPLDVQFGPDQKPEQYLRFFGHWGGYVEAIRLMKLENKSLKQDNVSGNTGVKKPQVVGEAKKFYAQGKYKEAINHIINHIDLIDKSRQTAAMNTAFVWAITFNFLDEINKLVKIAKKGSDQEAEFLSHYYYLNVDFKKAINQARKLSYFDSFHVYWASMYMVEVDKNNPDFTLAMEYIKKAYFLAPSFYQYQLFYSYELVMAGAVQEGLAIFDKIPIRTVSSTTEIEYASHLLLDFGPIPKLMDFFQANLFENPNQNFLENIKIYEGLAIMYSRFGDIIKSRMYTRKLLKLDPNYQVALDNLQILRWQEGYFEETFSYFVENHNDLSSYNLYGFVLAKKLGKTKEVENFANRLKKILISKESTIDRHFHATNIIFPLLMGDLNAVKVAVDKAKKDLYRTEGLENFLSFLVKLLELSPNEFSKAVKF